MTGAELMKLPGLDVLAIKRILSEIGLDMSRWPSEKHFQCGSQQSDQRRQDSFEQAAKEGQSCCRCLALGRLKRHAK
jgi:transposase